MEKKKPKANRKPSKSNRPSKEEFLEMMKQAKLDREIREKEGYSVMISYPIQYRKGVEATIITSADGYEHFFYPTKSGGWDYDGGGMEFEGGKIKRAKAIVGSVKVFLPVKSIKIGRGGNGLTIVDAKGETYKFS